MSILWRGAIILIEEAHCASLTFTFVLALGQIFLSCSVLFLFLPPAAFLQTNMGCNQEERGGGGHFPFFVFEAALSSVQEAGSRPLSLTQVLPRLAYGHELDCTLVCTLLGDWIGLCQKLRAVKQQEP